MVDTLPFETFWRWITGHPNCILRAGAPDAVLYDDDDYHWHFAAEDVQTLLVQVIRGKRLLGELFLDADRVTYVEVTEGDLEGEFTFELISESGDERFVLFFFVLSHGYEESDEPGPRHVH